MSQKKVYFFKINLYDQNGVEEDFRKLAPILQEIVVNNAIDQGTYRALDLTVGDEYTHIIWDIFDYEHTRLFGRLSKQLPSNAFVTRDYVTLEKEDVKIPDETRAGIEKYTYGSLDYATGIFSIVSAQSAPTEKVIANAFWKFNRNYMVQIVPIPNADAIDVVYRGDDSKITRVEVEVPLPDAAFLQNVLGWADKDVLDALGKSNLDMSLVVKPIRRRGCVTKDSEETKGLLDCIFNQMQGYNKARLKAKTRKVGLREYDLFEQNFSYPVEIAAHHIVGKHKVYYTVDELAGIFKNSIVGVFETNRRLLAQIAGR